MRVLHIWNTAGVASIIAKYQSKLLGWHTWVIMRKDFDPFGLTTYGELINTSSFGFIIRSILESRKYEIIHVHDLDIVIPLIKSIFPRKIVLIHYHGNSIRKKWRHKRKYWKRADYILVSTPDLLVEAPSEVDVEYIPNPIDTELFKPIPEVSKEKNSALFFYEDVPKYQKSKKWAQEIASRLGLKLVIHNRKTQPIPYKQMPLFLNRFEYFIDHCWVPALSKTALEALACGLKVIRWDGRILTELPEMHKPEFVVSKLEQIYKRLLIF